MLIPFDGILYAAIRVIYVKNIISIDITTIRK